LLPSFYLDGGLPNDARPMVAGAFGTRNGLRGPGSLLPTVMPLGRVLPAGLCGSSFGGPGVVRYLKRDSFCWPDLG
jgi:hypothetical protein